MLVVPEIQGMASLGSTTKTSLASTKKKILSRTLVTTASLPSKMRKGLARSASARQIKNSKYGKKTDQIVKVSCVRFAKTTSSPQL